MNSKSILFLIISSILWFLFELNGIIYRSVFSVYNDWLSAATSVVLLQLPIGFALLGFHLLKPGFLNRKKLAVVFTAMSAFAVILMIYFRFIYFTPEYFWLDPFRASLDYSVSLFPISILVFWIMLLRGKMKKGALWLFAGALLISLSMFSEKISMAFTYGYDFERGTWETTSEILRLLNMVFPISLVAFALSIIQKEKTIVPRIKQEIKYDPQAEVLDNLPPAPENSTSMKESEKEKPDLTDWMGDFLAAMIPVFGLAFLIWRGQNKTDVVRRNWAIAHLFWNLIGSAIALWILAPVFQRTDPLRVFWGLTIIILVSLFIFWILIVRKASNDNFDDGDESSVPSTLTWTGWILVSSLPVVGLIFLILSATDRENRIRRNWAVARLAWTGIIVVYCLFLLNAYQEIQEFAMRYPYYQF